MLKCNANDHYIKKYVVTIIRIDNLIAMETNIDDKF